MGFVCQEWEGRRRRCRTSSNGGRKNYKLGIRDMPRIEPGMSYTAIRNYTEKWQWEENGRVVRGFNPPIGAKNVERVPFYIKYITKGNAKKKRKGGKVESGIAVCIKVMPRELSRLIKFVDSGEIRQVFDLLVMEVDGVRFMAH